MKKLPKIVYCLSLNESSPKFDLFNPEIIQAWFDARAQIIAKTWLS